MARSLIRNEKEVAERILNNGFTDGFTFSEALAVAKYYRHILGYGDRRIKTNLINFCNKHDGNFEEVANAKTVKSIIRRSNNHFNISDTIVIRKNELEEIQKLKSFRFQRIMLAMLAVAKLTKKTYVPTYRWADVKQIASKSVSTQDMRNCITYAYKCGLIGEPSDNGAYHKLLFIENESEPVFVVTTEKDFMHLSKNYETYIGGSFRYCIICGEKFLRTGKKHTLCAKHAAEKEKERTKYRVRKHRNKM